MSDDFEKRCQEMLNQFNAAHPYQPYQPGTSPMGYQGSGFQSQSFNDPFPGFAGSFGFGGGYSGQPYATQSEMGPGFGNQPFPSQSTGFGHSSFPGHRPGSGFGFSSFNNAAPQPQGFPQPQTSHPPPPSGGSFGAPPPSMPDGSSEVHHHKKSKKFKIRIPFFSFNISESNVSVLTTRGFSEGSSKEDVSTTGGAPPPYVPDDAKSESESESDKKEKGKGKEKEKEW